VKRTVVLSLLVVALAAGVAGAATGPPSGSVTGRVLVNPMSIALVVPSGPVGAGNTFKVRATITNAGATPLQNVGVTLVAPSGLALGEPATQQVAQIGAASSSTVQWAACSTTGGGYVLMARATTTPYVAESTAQVVQVVQAKKPSCRATSGDTTPPALTLPANMTVNAPDNVGATVTYVVAATDNLDSAPVVSCSPPSGSLFPVGTTTVNCSATDASGNSARGSFDVTVISLVQQQNLAAVQDALISWLNTVSDSIAANPPSTPQQRAALCAAIRHAGNTITTQIHQLLAARFLPPSSGANLLADVSWAEDHLLAAAGC